MKKMKKYFPLIVGLVILLSVAAYGTRAYFSDSANQDTGIELTLGDVEVKGESGSWTYKTESLNEDIDVKGGATSTNKETVTEVSKDKELGKYVTITNARPGDSFSKTFTFENTGSLEQKLTFEPVTKINSSIFLVTWDKPGFTDADITLKPKNGTTTQTDHKVTVTMEVKVDTVGDQQFKTDTSANKKILTEGLNKLKFVDETVKVQAVQTNGTYGQ